MSSVVFAQPYVPPPPAPSIWNGVSMTWTGADGSEWNLSDPSSGIVLLQDGVTGLHFPGFDRYVSTGPATAGNRYRGSRVQARPVEWLVHIWAGADQGSEYWMELDRAFWSSFSEDVPGVWTVKLPGGQTRRLTCRMDSTGDFSYDHDPVRHGWATYPLNLIADDPFWHGDPIKRSWKPADPVLFFNEDDGYAPQFNIMSTSSYSDATMTNAGDVASWPVWTVTGPVTDMTITVNGGTIGVPDIGEGQSLTIDTDPRVATAIRDDGIDLSGQCNPWDPRPIPPGQTVPVEIQMPSDTGSLACSVTPSYYRGL